MIDYVIENDRTWERVTKFEVEDKIDSNHRPITVEIRGEKGVLRRNKRRRNIGRGRWTEDGRKEFREAFGERSKEEGGIEKEWEVL